MGSSFAMRAGIVVCHAFEEVPVFVVERGMLLAEVPDLARIIAAFRRTIGCFGPTSIVLAQLDIGVYFDNRGLSHPNVHKFRAVGE
jgi:hypothetical protein